MEANWYDTLETMLPKIETLQGLRELFQARQEAGYQRHERLKEWCVLGRWYLDTCGNCMRIERGISLEERRLVTLLPWDQVFQVLGKYIGNQKRNITSVYNSSLPFENSLCPECQKGWGRHQLDDVYCYYSYQEETWKFWHKGCWAIHKNRDDQQFFKKVFEDSGFAEFQMEMLPNEYCPCEHCPPWWDVHTSNGTIKIGWRKRVINIDWSRFRCTPPNFQSEDVTQGSSYIHAWGDKKAVEYLSQLRSGAA